MAFKPPRDPIVAVVYDIVARQRFTSRGDLRETVKEACARRKIPDYDTARVEDAIDHVARQRRDVPVSEPAPPPVPQAPRFSVEAPAISRPAVTREEPVPLHDRDPIAYAKHHLRRGFQADRVRAARLIAEEITDTIARCEALEATVAAAGDETA